MKILEKWLRPKWQHPDAAVRLKALAEESLTAADYHALALNDPDRAVRELVIGKLDSIGQLLEVLRAHPAAQPAIAARLCVLLQQGQAAAIGAPLAPAMAAVANTPCLADLASRAADPEIRVAAVALVKDESLLRRCALEDKSVEVRLHALERIDDEDALQEIGRLAKGHDKTVARVADQRLDELRSRRERASEREQLLGELAALIEVPLLDAEALQRARLHWQGLEADAGPEHRERYAALAPRLDARLAALRQAQQEDLSHKAAREQLLQQLRQVGDDLASADPKEARSAMKIMCAGWEQATPLQDGWTERLLQEEWQEALAQLESGLREREKLARQEETVAAAIAKLEATLERGGLTPRDVEAAQQHHVELTAAYGDNPAFEKPLQRVQHLVERIAKQLAQQQEEFKANRARLKEAVEALEGALEQKTLDPANSAYKTATGLLADLPRPLHPQLQPLQRRLAKCEPLLRELRSWRSWSSDKAREELVAEAKQLAEADVSTEERAKTLASLRARWKALGGGSGKARRLWTAFDAACTAAHAPIKQERDEQAQQREANLAARAALCARLEQLQSETDWTTPDWRSLDREVLQAKRQWRDTGPVPHKQWDSIRARFDQALAGIEQPLGKERRHNFLQRQALAKEAQALAAVTDTRQAVAEARRLREAWQVSVASARKDEQQLWQAFNGALDEVFKRDRSARDEFMAGLEEQRQQAEALCARLEELAQLDAAGVRAQRAELTRLREAFDQLGALPKQARPALEARFRQAYEQLRQRLAAADLAHAQQALVQYLVLHELCERAEALAQAAPPDAAALEGLEAKWQGIDKPPAEKELLEQLNRRFEAARAAIQGSGPAPAAATLASNAAARNQFCLDLEILRKQESPPAAQSLRMQRQVALLENAMKGANEQPERQIRRLQLAYLRQGPVPRDQQEELARRFGQLFP